MTRTVWLVDAFTNKQFGGNVAGVVPAADGLTDSEMQAIAAELAASETAFVLNPTDTSADLRIRYFTPKCEVDLCGHATIGSISGLVADGRLQTKDNSGLCKVETRVGILPITYGWQGNSPYAEMRQARPQFRDIEVNREELAGYLGIRASDIHPDLPLGVSYTGLWDLFVPLVSLQTMSELTPNDAGLATWNNSLGVASTHVYTTDCVHASSDFHARDFSPALGIPEDPATGTATGALTALLRQHGVVAYNQSLIFEQGFEIGRESIIHARIEPGNEVDGDAVYVSGQAYVSLKGELNM